MSASSIARSTVTVLLTFTVVVSLVAAPTAAVGHDPTHVGEDDEPVGVDADNDSVGVSAGDDGVSVGTDGVSTDTDDTTDATDDVSSGSTEEVTDGIPTTQDEQDEELPFNYSDINATLSLVPVDLCQRPPDAPEPPSDLPEPPVENPAPVDPTNPPSPPLTQCDVFNPYDPPFDPTDAPDDPEADYGVYQQEVGPDGVTLYVGGGASPDSDYPGGVTIVGVEASQDDVTVVQFTRGDDGSRDLVAFSAFEYEPGTQNGSLAADGVAIGRTAGADITCDGENCTFSQGAAPVGDQTVPTNSSSGGGDGDDGTEPPAEVPCQTPGAPEVPVDPSNPPEPIPPVENPAPVDPTNPPSPPLGPCDAYDPNDPPNPQPSPDANYGVYEMSNDTVVVGGSGAYNDAIRGNSIVAVMQNDDGELQLTQFTRYNDGQKPGMLFSDVRYTPGTREGQAVVDSRVIGKRVGANITCDGENCTFSQGAAPVGDQAVPTNSSSGGDDGDDGGDGGAEPPAEVPCQAPVGPGDAPDPPVDPSNPPEPIPPVENPAPVDPTNPPSPPLGPCDAYDPNDPPSPQPNPDANYGVYEVSNDTVVVGGSGEYNDDANGRTILAIEQGENETTLVQYGSGEDGQKPFTTFVVANVDRDSLTKAGFTGYQFDGGSAVAVRVFGKNVDASLTCDGEFCYLTQSAAPVGDQQVRIATADADEEESTVGGAVDDAGEQAPEDTTATTGGSGTDDGSTDGSSTNDGGTATTSEPSANSAGTTGGGAVAAASAPAAAPTSPVAPAFPSAFENGIPDAASAAEALMDLV